MKKIKACCVVLLADTVKHNNNSNNYRQDPTSHVFARYDMSIDAMLQKTKSFFASILRHIFHKKWKTVQFAVKRG